MAIRSACNGAINEVLYSTVRLCLILSIGFVQLRGIELQLEGKTYASSIRVNLNDEEHLFRFQYLTNHPVHGRILQINPSERMNISFISHGPSDRIYVTKNQEIGYHSQTADLSDWNLIEFGVKSKSTWFSTNSVQNSHPIEYSQEEFADEWTIIVGDDDFFGHLRLEKGFENMSVHNLTLTQNPSDYYYESIINPIGYGNCSEIACKNNGICTQIGGTARCACLPGFQSSFCELRKHQCLDSPCMNGGKCIEHESLSFECLCKKGYEGPLCEVGIGEENPTVLDEDRRFKEDINTCKSLEPCRNKGKCVNLKNRNGYMCVCDLMTGWVGRNCTTRIEDLGTIKAGFGELVQSGIDGPSRTVWDVLTGRTSGDKNLSRECAGIQNPCRNNGTVKVFRYVCGCECPLGFTGLLCEVDLNECELVSPCLNGATCVNTPGSFKCECPPGFTGDQCQWSTDECRWTPNSCMGRGRCVEGSGCVCEKGFYGKNCQYTLEDIRKRLKAKLTEIEIETYEGLIRLIRETSSSLIPSTYNEIGEFRLHRGNPCQNGGVPIKTHGGMRCDCPITHTGTYCQYSKCEPNPCVRGFCVGTAAGFVCECDLGFVGRRCEYDQSLYNVSQCKSGYGRFCEVRGIAVRSGRTFNGHYSHTTAAFYAWMLISVTVTSLMYSCIVHLIKACSESVKMTNSENIFASDHYSTTHIELNEQPFRTRESVL